MNWLLWQRVCGWAALACAFLWAAKFTMVSLGAQGQFPEILKPVAEPLVGFLIPTLCALLGLIVPFALAAPYLGGRRLRFTLPVALAAGVAAIVAVALLQGAAQSALSGSPSHLLRTEGSVPVAAAISLVFACWLLRPAVRTRAVAAVLAVGGILWLAKGVAVAAGATPGGWTTLGYQAGLWLLATAAAIAVFDAVRRRRFAVPAILAAAYVAAGVLGAAPILGGELGLLALAVLALGMAAAFWTTRSRTGAPGVRAA